MYAHDFMSPLASPLLRSPSGGPGLDYATETTELVFLPNMAHLFATTTIYDDKLLEGTETYNLTLHIVQSSGSVVVSEPSQALVHIEDNDGMPLLCHTHTHTHTHTHHTHWTGYRGFTSAVSGWTTKDHTMSMCTCTYRQAEKATLWICYVIASHSYAHT